jgi:hypothetical protein
MVMIFLHFTCGPTCDKIAKMKIFLESGLLKLLDSRGLSNFLYKCKFHMQITQAIPQANSDVAHNSSLICHHCDTMCHQGNTGSRPGHWGQNVVCNRNLYPYVDRRWHIPSTSELCKWNEVVISSSTVTSILRTLLILNVLIKLCTSVYIY